MEISLKDLIRIFKQNFVFMLLIAVIFAMMAFGYSSFLMNETYSTSVKMYVSTSESNSYESDLSSYNYATKLVNTYIEMLNTNSFFSKVSDDLQGEFTLAQIKGSTSFSSNETEVFSITVTAYSPDNAKRIADSIAKVAPEVISEINQKSELKIVDPASFPTRPSGPNTKKNTLMAFGAGFLIAMIFSFIRDFLDVKIKYQSEMSTLCDYPILAAIPDFNENTAKVTSAYSYSSSDTYGSYVSYSSRESESK